MNTLLVKRPLHTTRTENPFFQPDDAYLRMRIDTSIADDPSLRSLSYIRMTSRKGLFAYEGQYGILLYSVHPNRSDTYIIYSPEIELGFHDVYELAGILKTRGRNVEVVRIPAQYLSSCLEVTQGQPIDELVLDYIYPVHVIDTRAVSQMQGRRFLKFRNKINAIRKTPIRLEKMQISRKAVSDMKVVASRWAELLFGPEGKSNADYIFYVLNDLALLSHLQGLVAYQGDEPVGFTLWEMPAQGYSTANSLIHCCLHDRGLSELLHHEIAVSLLAQDVRFLSLGGAETEGLDAFKRKMNPVRSLIFKTVIM